MNARFTERLDESFSRQTRYGEERSVERSDLGRGGVSLQTAVLDNAFQTINEKYRKHLKIIKPALDQLLIMVEENHQASGLKELMAVKKSLSQFEQNMLNVKTEINKFSKELTDEDFQEDIGGVFEYFNHNILEIELENRKLIGMIEDCEQFVSIHLDTVRSGGESLTPTESSYR